MQRQDGTAGTASARVEDAEPPGIIAVWMLIS